MQRIACSLIGASLAVITVLVALLLSDALSPGRLPPMLAFWAACAAGGMLIAGLLLLERGSRHIPALAGMDGGVRFPH
ncbi:hypothetical protein ACFQY5_25700 [Paeniroseomonas aquatica]|uniref:Uncharacterized protein n=1 Tax=Paeniroseomonas aquatica TaxID=373043 RepID=A0ABT8AEF5_9PROT|nr:hypothetical protein [Paeniroseomonas aquatica]MDN3568119.1 hypothetical protein [Paeniroseomonas aquatica]